MVETNEVLCFCLKCLSSRNDQSIWGFFFSNPWSLSWKDFQINTDEDCSTFRTLSSLITGLEVTALSCLTRSSLYKGVESSIILLSIQHYSSLEIIPLPHTWVRTKLNLIEFLSILFNTKHLLYPSQRPDKSFGSSPSDATQRLFPFPPQNSEHHKEYKNQL